MAGLQGRKAMSPAVRQILEKRLASMPAHIKPLAETLLNGGKPTAEQQSALMRAVTEVQTSHNASGRADLAVEQTAETRSEVTRLSARVATLESEAAALRTVVNNLPSLVREQIDIVFNTTTTQA